MRKYEIMYILKADLDEAARAEVMKKLETLLTSHGAEVTKTDEKFGLRELAYSIKDETKGYYVILKVNADQTALYEFNRKVKINPSVLRHLVTVDQD